MSRPPRHGNPKRKNPPSSIIPSLMGNPPSGPRPQAPHNQPPPSYSAPPQAYSAPPPAYSAPPPAYSAPPPAYFQPPQPAAATTVVIHHHTSEPPAAAAYQYEDYSFYPDGYNYDYSDATQNEEFGKQGRGRDYRRGGGRGQNEGRGGVPCRGGGQVRGGGPQHVGGQGRGGGQGQGGGHERGGGPQRGGGPHRGGGPGRGEGPKHGGGPGRGGGPVQGWDQKRGGGSQYDGGQRQDGGQVRGRDQVRGGGPKHGGGPDRGRGPSQGGGQTRGGGPGRGRGRDSRRSRGKASGSGHPHGSQDGLQLDDDYESDNSVASLPPLFWTAHEHNSQKKNRTNKKKEEAAGNETGDFFDHYDSDNSSASLPATVGKKGNRTRQRRGRGSRHHQTDRTLHAGDEDDSDVSVDSVANSELGNKGTMSEAIHIDSNSVFHWILKSKKGVAKIHEIMNRRNLVPVGVSAPQLVDFLKHQHQFKVFTCSTALKHSVVEVYSINMRMCNYHFPQTPCSKDSCRFLHMCRDYIAGACKKASHCTLGHSLKEERNAKIFENNGMDIFSEDEQLIILRYSLLRVCPYYSSNELCAGDQACAMLHLCADFIRGKCCKPGDECTFGHDFLSPHNARVINVHRLGKLNPQQLKKSILIIDKNVFEHVAVKGSHLDEELHLPSKGSVDTRVDHNRVIKWILEKKAGATTIGDLLVQSEFFPHISSAEDMEQYLRNFKGLRLDMRNKQRELARVQVCLPMIKLCYKYRDPEQGCTDEKCTSFHLCSLYVANCDKKHTECDFSHNISDHHNLPVLKKCSLDRMPRKLAMTAIRSTCLVTCLEHNTHKGACSKGPYACFKIHICDDFLRGTCSLSHEDCPKGHSFDAPNVKSTLKFYRSDAEKLLSNFLRKIIIPGSPVQTAVPKKSFTEFCEIQRKNDEALKPREEIEQLSVREKPVPKPRLAKKVDPAKQDLRSTDSICEENLAGKCTNGDSCKQLHHGSRFLWQVECEGTWISLTVDNDMIEKSYSDPTSNEYWLVKLPDQCSKGTGVSCINFDTMQCKFGEIRRLSTESFCAPSPSKPKRVDDDTLKTIWIWYWKDPSNNWIPFSKDGKGPYQDVIESRFLRDTQSTYFFELDDAHFFYKIEFGSMVQTNLTTGKDRQIRRRPLFQSLLPSYMKTRYFLPQDLPSKQGWSPMDTVSPNNFECVPLGWDNDDRKNAEKEFYATMSQSEYTIKNVARVQNIKLWRKYQRKMEEMRERLDPEDFKELELFHGTADVDTVHCICSQSFDHRMHGRNATVYGKGAYFATTAEYSNRYTDQSKHEKKHMFIAKVMVGKFTRGDSTMQRPPPVGTKKHGDLYDSVVNDESNPSIYVVFENDQSYPLYLIEYTVNSSSPPIDPLTGGATSYSNPHSTNTRGNVSYTRQPVQSTTNYTGATTPKVPTRTTKSPSDSESKCIVM